MIKKITLIQKRTKMYVCEMYNEKNTISLISKGTKGPFLKQFLYKQVSKFQSAERIYEYLLPE